MLECGARWIAGGTPRPPLSAEGRWNWILSNCCTTGSPSQVVKGVLGLTFTFEIGVTLSGSQPHYLAWLGYGYAMSEHKSEAAKILTQLTQLSAHKYVPADEVAALCAGLGRRDQAFQWLQKACEQEGCPTTMWDVKSDPTFDNLRSDPRYADLLRRSGLPQ